MSIDDIERKRALGRKAELKYSKTEKGKRVRRDRERVYRNKYKSLLLDIWGAKCKNCGFEDTRALQIDHVNGGGTKDLKHASRYAYYKKVYEEVLDGSEKYQLLCANCNWIKRFKNKESTPRI